MIVDETRRKVFGIGLGKTGTTSLAAAMKILGFSVLHAPRTVDGIEAIEFANDIGVAWRYLFLDHVYPQARFILTVRNIPSWLESCAKHARQTRKGAPLRRLENRFMCFGRTDFEPSDFRRSYERHVRDVLEHFSARPHKLLVMNVCAGDGWGILCPFLDVAIPEVEFPHLRPP